MPTEAGLPGVRRPAVERIYVESDYAKLRARLVGGHDARALPDSDVAACRTRRGLSQYGIEVVNCMAGIVREKHSPVFDRRLGKVIGNLLLGFHSPGPDELFGHDEQRGLHICLAYFLDV